MTDSDLSLTQTGRRSGDLGFHLLVSTTLMKDRIGLLRFTRSGAFARMQNVPFGGLPRIRRFRENVDHIGLPMRERSRLDERNSAFRHEIAQTASSKRCAGCPEFSVVIPSASRRSGSDRQRAVRG